MSTIIEATYDGTVFRPVQAVQLQPNTPVRLTVETVGVARSKSGSFLQTARALTLDGPADWSDRLDDYLYGAESPGGK
jgi:predicted DNA-binding antitoxin AbrB/MazE fold protein